MKKISPFSITAALTFFCITAQAQWAVVATGGDATGTGGSASYSIGQVADTTNQGVQQPYEFATVGADDNADISLSISVYPNPAAAYVILKIDLPELQNLRYEFYDMSGRLLFSNNVTNTLTTLPVENLSAATYLLRVTDNNRILKTFKIIKNH